MIDYEKLNKLKENACEHMEQLNQNDFNAGQAYAIRLMFQWIEEIYND